MGDLLRIKRGLEKDLPSLMQGEFGFCTDTEKLFIGGVSGNIDITSVRNNIYNVDTFIKKYPNEQDDVKAIQEAIDTCSNNGGGYVIFSDNTTYNLNSHTGLFPNTSVHAMILLKDNVTLIGGNLTTLKVGDNYTDNGDYIVFGNETVNNLSIKNLFLDQNGTMNTVIDSSGNVRRAYALWIKNGKNITIDKFDVKDSPSRNVINIANFTSKHEVENTTIRNCTFHNVGGAVVGNENQSDHSTIYAQSKNLHIYNNHFFNDETVIDTAGVAQYGLTAIEVHEGGNVYGNKVENYHLGMYVVNQAFEGDSFHVLNNHFKVTRAGVQYWTTYRVKNLWVKDNYIHLFGETQINGGYQYKDSPTQYEIENFYYINNTTYFENALETSVSNGLYLSALKNAYIINNTFEGSSGDCLHLEISNQLIDIDNVKIIGNTFKDYGFTTAGTSYWGIYVVGVAGATVKNLLIDDNTFIDEGGVNGSRGIRLNGGTIDNVRIGKGNSFVGITSQFDQLNNTNHTNINVDTSPLTATHTWDVGSLVDGTGQTSTSIVVTGATFGDFVQVSAPFDLQGLTVTGYVASASVVKIRVDNQTGVTVDLASGEWKIKVTK